MREQLFKLNEGSQRGNNELPTLINTTVGSIGLGVIYHMGSTATTISRDDMEKQLKYISNLAHHLYMEVSYSPIVHQYCYFMKTSNDNGSSTQGE